MYVQDQLNLPVLLIFEGTFSLHAAHKVRQGPVPDRMSLSPTIFRNLVTFTFQT